MEAKRQPKGLHREPKGSEAVHQGLGLILRRSWRGLEAVLERSWAALGAILGAPGASWGDQDRAKRTQKAAKSSRRAAKP